MSSVSNTGYTAIRSPTAGRYVKATTAQQAYFRIDRSTRDGVESQSLRADIPAGDLGDPADFGSVAAMLCAEQARFVTGVGLHVDGGAFRGLQ